ncbi:MAG: NERD domain-containing protein, partial [Oscillospiraceae bacterium]
MTVQVITIMIVFVAIVLALTFVPRIFGGEEKKLTKHLKNNLSSAKLDRKLKGFALRNGYKYLPACHFEKGEQALDVSGILIGYFGVLAVIANGRNGEIYGTANDEQWLQTTEKEKVYFENPINTASLAIRLIREPLSAARVHN